MLRRLGSFTCLLLLFTLSSACRGHWVPLPPAAANQWNAVRALPGGYAWVAGNNGLVYATIDGGTTWSPQATPFTSSILSVDFASPLAGWIAGESGNAAHTTDGGSTWTPVTIVSDDLGLGPPDTISPITSPDEAHAWALVRWADATFLYHTSNAGVSWTAVPYTNHGYSSPGTVYGMGFTSDAGGWLIASRLSGANYIPVVLRTANGGTTWQSLDSPSTALNGSTNPSWEVTVQAASPDTVWFHVWDTTNSKGMLFRVNQATPGTWTWNVWPWDNRVRAISFAGLARGVMVGDVTWETPDTFATIHRTTVSGASPLAADFASPAEGIAAGPDGAVYRWIPDVWGDANQDGRVNVLDACAIADLAAGGTPAPSVSRALSDVNGDGSVSVSDAARALRITGGLGF